MMRAIGEGTIGAKTWWRDRTQASFIKTGLLVSAAIVLIAACSDGDDGTAGSETLPVIGDAGSIWCDEQRWQVVVRASQLGLSTPPTNPAEEVWLAEFQQRGDQLDVDVQLGRIVPGSKLQALEDRVVEANAVAARYESGEWDTSGVLDDDWATWRIDEPAAYARACAAAYELSGGPSAPLGASSNLSSQPAAAAETTAPVVPTTTVTPPTQVPATDASVTSTTTGIPSSTVSSTTTTVADGGGPETPSLESSLDVSASEAQCSTAGIDVTFKVENNGTLEVELTQVALFPFGPMGHSFLNAENWWPLPTVPPGELVSHRELFAGGSLSTYNPGDELEVFVDSGDSSSSALIVCS